MGTIEKKPIKVLLRHEGKVPGEIILVDDSRYTTFELWATKKSTAQGGKPICKFMKKLPKVIPPPPPPPPIEPIKPVEPVKADEIEDVLMPIKPLELPKLQISIDELETVIDNDKDKLILFCDKHDVPLPDDHLWADRYASIIEYLEEKE